MGREVKLSKAIVIVSPFLGSLFSAVLLLLSFPKHEISWMAWFGLVPLLVAVSFMSRLQGFLLSLLCGMVFFAGLFRWMLSVPGYEIYHHAILMVYFGSFFGVFGFVFCAVARKRGIAVSCFAAPFVWVSLEHLRSNLSFMALPWGLLAHSQYENVSLIQIASITGTLGITFLIVSVNAGLAAILLTVSKILGQGGPGGLYSLSRGGAIAVGGTAGLLVLMSMLYGEQMLSRPFEGRPLKISVLQGNIDQDKKWDPAFAKFIMQTYSDLSKQASTERPDLVVWPEAATPGFVLKQPALLNQTASLIREVQTHFLIGSSEFPKFDKDLREKGQSGNTAIFFSPRGDVLGQYLKITLLPFSEYVPYERTVPWPDFLLPDKRSSHIAGREIKIFSLDGVRFGTIICWEGIFPDLTRKLAAKGARFIINIANEAWFGETAGPYQFLSMNVFRCVENRVFMVRCVNTGISCFIDSCGRIFRRLSDDTGRELFIKGVLTDHVVPMKGDTIYSRYGDWLPWLCVVFSVAFLAEALLWRKRLPSKARQD